MADLRIYNPNQKKHYYYHMSYYNIQTMKWLIILTILIVSAKTVDQGDWVDPFLLPIEFKVNPFFAGYLRATTIKSLYYVYTPSQGNPSKDPLVVVIAPFPGCSTLHHWLYTGGQFVFTRNKDSFRLNPNNWNKIANVLYIEGPAGTGFSFGVGQNVSDSSTQTEYFRAIHSFYDKFPELKDQKMYLTGFGHAGIIAPKLALNIIEHNRNESTPAWLKLNISGILLYNPCTLAQECDSHFEFNQFTVRALRNTFFISAKTYENYRTHCTLRTSECEKVQQSIASDFKITGADIHNLYTQCLHQPGDYGCIDHIGIDAFLNSNTVKTDMHVNQGAKWNLCNFTLSQIYERDPSGSLYTYQTLLREEHNLRIWIVSGTQSARYPTLGTKRWVDQVKMNLKLPTIRLWEPWFYQGINAGEVETIPGLTLITLRSAGFYLYDDQPEIAWHIYESYLNGVPV